MPVGERLQQQNSTALMPFLCDFPASVHSMKQDAELGGLFCSDPAGFSYVLVTKLTIKAIICSIGIPCLSLKPVLNIDNVSFRGTLRRKEVDQSPRCFL